MGGRAHELHPQDPEIRTNDLDRKNQGRDQEAFRGEGQADAA